MDGYTADPRTLSLNMNRCLSDIGVTEEIIKIRKNCFLQIECNETVFKINAMMQETAFYLGSQSEGTTTPGLRSDMDTVLCAGIVKVVTDSRDIQNALKDSYVFEMVRSPIPGYCFLRDISFQVPEWTNPRWLFLWCKCMNHHKDNTMFLKNSMQITSDWYGKVPKMEGPAILHTLHDGTVINLVWAFPCTTWPTEERESFLYAQQQRLWPSEPLIGQILQSKCFVVPKGSDTGNNSDIEWRISFSCGERLLMFDLKVVQIRCYILMKYVKNTFLDSIPGCEGVISSYICKTALFHTVSQIPGNMWTEENLLSNFITCLRKLRDFILTGNCPHFIMPSHNLFFGKLNGRNREKLSREIERIIMSRGSTLLDVKIDEFGRLLQSEETYESTDNNLNTTQVEIVKSVGFEVIEHLAFLWLEEHQSIIHESTICDIQNIALVLKSNIAELSKKLKRLLRFSDDLSHQDMNESKAGFLTQCCKLRSMLGSLKVSYDIQATNSLSSDALRNMLLGLKYTDAASAHLKFASILIFCERYEFAELLLNIVAEKYSGHRVCSFCTCHGHFHPFPSRVCFDEMIKRFRSNSFLQILQENVGFCVTFFPCEINVCPKELQFEMFRVVFCKQKIDSKSLFKRWVHYAVIPPGFFLYFLQYKLYTEMMIPGKTEEALRSLLHYPELPYINIPFKDTHQETIWNLRGQCCEQEGHINLAMFCYLKSHMINSDYNAAKFLICCALCKQYTLKKGLGDLN